jgi:hypothetical protein
VSYYTSRGSNAYRASEIHQLIAGTAYKPSATQRGIIFCHGVGGDWSTWTQAAVVDKVKAVAEAGYPVISCDLSAAAYSGANWGNADHIDAIDDAWEYAKTTFGFKTDKVGLLATSMGVAGALAWAAANLTECFAVAGMIPVLDVNDIYVNDKGSLRAGIGTAYGITHPAAMSTSAEAPMSAHDPTQFGSTALNGLPVRLWTASDDTIASTTAAATTWAGKGATLTVTDLGAVGHAATSVSASQVVQFLDDNGGRS